MCSACSLTSPPLFTKCNGDFVCLVSAKQMFVEQMNENHPCYIQFRKQAVTYVTPRLAMLQWLLLDAVKILDQSLKNLHDLADVSLSFTFPPYLSSLLPAILNTLISTATH